VEAGFTRLTFILTTSRPETSECSPDLILRRANRLKNPDPNRATIVEGDVLDFETLKSAMQGQDVVYANLAGAMEQQAKTIVSTMHATGLKRLIFLVIRCCGYLGRRSSVCISNTG